MIIFGLVLTGSSLLRGTSHSPNDFLTWWQVVLLLAGLVGAITWRTVSIEHAELAASVAQFAATGGVYCRLLNDKVDQGGSLVVTPNLIAWNPGAYATASGCRPETVHRDALDRIEMSSTVVVIRRPTATIVTRSDDRISMIMRKRAGDRLMRLLSDCGLPVIRD